MTVWGVSTSSPVALGEFELLLGAGAGDDDVLLGADVALGLAIFGERGRAKEADTTQRQEHWRPGGGAGGNGIGHPISPFGAGFSGR